MLATAISCALSLALPQQPATPDAPARVAWQRTLEDALALKEATGLPLLIAVNMDGEVFNERFAATTYRDPTFVRSTRGYICVVASPDRHTDRDYDALGNRVECPRFGGCTCSEHINIEPELFRRFFNGNRNAPRHVGVGGEDQILFDRFLDRSMQTAIDAIAEHRSDKDTPHLRATDDLDELFARRDALARTLLERRSRAAATAGRRLLLGRAATAKNEPVDLLRMGLRDPDGDLVGLTALALSKVGGSSALIDIEDALARVEDVARRRARVDPLRQLGATDRAAARMAAHFSRVAEDLAAPWSSPWRLSELVRGREGVEAVLDRVEAAIGEKPEDDGLRLELATAQAAFACALMQENGGGIEFWLADAARNLARVTAPELRQEARALAAVVAWYTSDGENARKAATEALHGTQSARRADAWLAGNFLDVLLQLEAQTAYARAQDDELAGLAAEVGRALSVIKVLETRDAGLERGMLAGAGLLEFAGLRADARGVLQRLAVQFPGSLEVHNRWRNRVLVDLGAVAVRTAYVAFVEGAADTATAEWFAGYAALVAGDRHTLDGQPAAAEAAYGDAVQRFGRSAAANEDYADSSNHYAVFGLAGRALLRHQRGDSKGAVTDLLRAAALRPDSMDQDDALQRKPRGVALRVHDELASAGRAALAAQLESLLP